MKYLVMIVMAALLGLLFFVSRSPPPPAAAPAPSTAAPSPSPRTPQPISVPAQQTPPDDGRPDLLAEARAFRLNLITTLAEIREQCPDDWSREECNGQTRNYLIDRVETRDKDTLLALYDQYIAYEDHLAATQPLEGQDVTGSIEALQRARALYFDAATRAWLFGPEEARMAYELAKRRFLSEEADALPPGERVRRLEALRKQTLGRFFALFALKESPEEELELKLHLLGEDDLTADEQVLRARLQRQLEEARQRAEARAGADDPAAPP